MATTYPYSYGSARLTLEELSAKKTVRLLDAEFRRRVFAMIAYAASKGVPLGIGCGWRIQPNPPPRGFAKPGNSHHESMPAGSDTATAFACDMVPASSWKWMEANCARFGIRTFTHVNNEPWHIQPVDIPGGRSYRRDPYKLAVFPLPGGLVVKDKPGAAPKPATSGVTVPGPTLRRGATGETVRQLQAALKTVVDGEFGPLTEGSLKTFQANVGITADGVYGPQTAGKLRAHYGG